jgi:hypothetical protein
LTRVLFLFYISEMPKYAPWYDHSDTSNTRLMDAMADLRRMCCRAEHTNPHTTKPGSFAAIEAIKLAIDEWAERETGNREFFWGGGPKAR